MLVVDLIDIQHMQAVIKGFFFFWNATILVIWKSQWPQNPELKSSFSQFPSNFMAPMGPLKSRLDFQPALAARGL